MKKLEMMSLVWWKLIFVVFKFILDLVPKIIDCVFNY